jgi:hypothetical protein
VKSAGNGSGPSSFDAPILIVTWSVQPNREPVEERVIGERSVVPMPQFAVVGLLVATLYLLHPAIQGANF